MVALKTQEIAVVLPEDVLAWVERKAQQAYKTRSRYIRDLLVQLYRKENGAQP